MVGKKIAYISTNNSWSGSEELWTRSASDFINKGYDLLVGVKYRHYIIDALKVKHFLLKDRHAVSLLQRLRSKILRTRGDYSVTVYKMLKAEIPDLVIVSQGNNIDHDNVMKCCRELKIPYVTITNLVTEYHFLSIQPNNLAKLQDDYLLATANYFVSDKNLKLNNLMLAIEPANTEVISCPIVVNDGHISIYPKNQKYYKIGLVGRIECFHKGYDILLEIATSEKWKSRPLEFNVYGNGPHEEVLKQNISRLKISNIKLKGYSKSHDVWKENQILFMPSRMEGLALSLLEAMYCQRAAIVTDVGDASKLIIDGYNGFIAESATFMSLDNALEKAWENRDEWEEMGLKAALSLKTDYPVDAVQDFNKKIENILYKDSNSNA